MTRWYTVKISMDKKNSALAELMFVDWYTSQIPIKDEEPIPAKQIQMS